MPDNDHCKPSVPTAQYWWRHYRNTGSAAVFHVDLTPHANREMGALAWLDTKERARWNRFRHTRPQREFSLCRAALRAILCSQLDCNNEELAFETSKHGKPFALVGGIPAPVNFNVSHSGLHGLIALVPEGRIGVDVEERITRRGLDATIETAFSVNERAELASTGGEQKIQLFFRLWTMKEALIKALGRGLSMDMSEVEIPATVRSGERSSMFRFPRMPAVRWWLENLGNPDFAAAIAYELDPGSASENGATLP